jgi:hypothetical protein
MNMTTTPLGLLSSQQDAPGVASAFAATLTAARGLLIALVSSVRSPYSAFFDSAVDDDA